MAKSLIQYRNDFIEYCEVEKGLSPTTGKNYARFLEQFFVWLKKNNLTDLEPQELTEDHMWQYRVWLSRLPNRMRKTSRGLHTSTQSRYLIALRGLLGYFHEKSIPCLPTEKVKLPKERRERQVKFLQWEQVESLLTAPKEKAPAGLRDRAILEVLFSTGLRVAELMSLDRKHLAGAKEKSNFEMGIIGKGSYPRTVYFSERALFWIKKYLETRKDDDPALFIRLKGPHDDSLRMGVRGIELLVQKYAKISGIPVLATPHTLRHSFATDLLNNGVDIRMVQEFLGHRHIGTTQVYTHVTSKRLKDIHKQFHGGNKLR
ncbi:MAG: tyrosine-type recombinase/integrase [Patescibacteria group bacterium]